MMETHAVNAELLSRLIRGELPADNCLADPGLRERLVEVANFHGVRPLLAHSLRQREHAGKTLGELADSIAEFEISDAATGLVREKELRNTLEALAANGVPALLMKGTPLAYSHYPSPELRPRVDTDLLIPEDALSAVRSILQEQGYLVPHVDGDQSMQYQFNAEKRDRFGVDHVLDVHWKLSNHNAFAGLFSFEELAGASVPVSELGSNARALGNVHALLLACMHRVGHIHSPLYVDGIPHSAANRLIWLYDIHLLVSQMTAEELQRFAALAIEKSIGAVCADGLQRAARHFNTPVSSALLEAVTSMGNSEPSARYLVPGRGRHLLTELGSLSGWRARARYLKALALPESGYLLQKYGTSNRLRLPLLYLHRGLTGLLKLGRSSGHAKLPDAGDTVPAERFD